jgi:rRNA pseudouridine-1189 N-methylase Emg1 (Nep1/Mra1 family)
MWYKVRLLQMPERQRLPKQWKQYIIHFNKETNGIIKELLKEKEIDITNNKPLIYAAGTVITEIVTKLGNTVRNIKTFGK